MFKKDLQSFILEKAFSYRLDVSVSPHWNRILNKILKPNSEKEFNEFVEKYKSDKTINLDLYPGRSYNFTEYYDSVSGLTQRIQMVHLYNKTHTECVDEFSDIGYILNELRDYKRDEGKDESNKFSIKVTEDSIVNNVFDKYVGGIKAVADNEDYLCSFPLNEIFNFLLSLGLRFNGSETNTVVKWPDNIEKSLEKSGIKYTVYLDYEPKLFDIEKHDRNFYEKNGKPKIALYGSEKGFFDGDLALYQVGVKVFKPDENDRINPSVLTN